MKFLNQKIITIIGKTNTGKSTLFNNLIKKKKSIITPKKNTTTKCILGILEENQTILIDTPGPIFKHSNNNINKSIYDSLIKSTLILIVIDTTNLTTEDFFILDLAKKYKKKKIILINKIDTLKQKDILLPFIKKITNKYTDIKQIIPISNTKNINIEIITSLIKNSIDFTNTYYEYKDIKKKDYTLITKEFIRETLLNNLDKEIPYSTTSEILNKNLNKNITNLTIKLNITKNSHKKIIIGKNGEKIKKITNDLNRKAKKIYTNLNDIKIIINTIKKKK